MGSSSLNRDFKLFIFAKSSSLAGDITLKFALAFFVLRLTGSAGKFAEILTIGLLPIILLGPFVGPVVDKYNKKNILVLLDVLRAIIQLILFILYLGNGLTTFTISILLFLSATCEVFYTPTSLALLLQVAGKKDLAIANTIDATWGRIIEVLFPLVGTIIYGELGIGYIFIFNGLTFLLSALIVTSIAVTESSSSSRNQDIRKGFTLGGGIFKTDVRIVSLVGNGILTHIFFYPFFFIGIPHLLINIFKLQEFHFGIVESFATLGASTVFFIVPFLQKRYKLASNIGTSLTAVFVLSLVYLLLCNTTFISYLDNTPLLPVYFFGATSFCIFSALGTYLVFFRTFYLSTVPENLLGRFGATLAMFLCIGRFIGFTVFGYLFDSMQLEYSILFFGTGMFLKILTHLPFIIEDNRRRL